ncbi:MAG: hypothetical protein KME20_06920 [Kaiparowitsia implicata GSE-PSE-MK54-09C]|jgi:hypothetical protein|nr:hypothetical protein [Kaiparowitsia implicata GSE-PSE-MK54-09C]
MATPDGVKDYVAHWFQLGKRVLIKQGSEGVLPQPVLQGDRYSDIFETCWHDLVQHHAHDAYLEGTSETLADLLSSQWEVSPCARCGMPVPMLDLGVRDDVGCPCSDLPTWPDLDTPTPRSPVNTQSHLQNLHDRLSHL